MTFVLKVIVFEMTEIQMKENASVHCSSEM